MGRHVRTTITMLVLLGILVAGAWYGWEGLQSGGPSAAVETETPTPTTPTEDANCPPAGPRRLRAVQVQVSVYNAGAPSGSAGETSDALVEQGFRRGEVGDAPDSLEVGRRGIAILTAEPDSAPVRLVRRQFGRPQVLERDRSLGPGVNVLVAEAFDGLRRNAPTLIRIRRGAAENCLTPEAVQG